MSIYNSYKTSPDLEKNGVWLNYGDCKILVARAGGANKRFEALAKARLKNYQKAIQVGALSNQKATEIMQEIYSESVVLDWEGVTDENGKELPFSKENVLKVFKDLPDLFLDIDEQCRKISNFRQELLEEDAKNLKSS